MTWAWGSGLWASAGGWAGRSLRPKVVGKARLAVLVHHQEEMNHGRPHADESAPACRGSRDFLLRGSAKVARGGARGAGLAVWLGAVRSEGRGGWGERHKRSPLARRCRRRQDAGGAESRRSQCSWRERALDKIAKHEPRDPTRTKCWAVRPRPGSIEPSVRRGAGYGVALVEPAAPRSSRTRARPPTGAPAPHHRAGSADGGGLPRGRARCHAQG